MTVGLHVTVDAFAVKHSKASKIHVCSMETAKQLLGADLDDSIWEISAEDNALVHLFSRSVPLLSPVYRAYGVRGVFHLSDIYSNELVFHCASDS